MSRCMLSPLRYHRAAFVMQSLLPSFARACLFSTDSTENNGKSKGLVRNTTILVQQGSNIQELPVVVRKVAEDEFVSLISNKIIENQPTPESADQSSEYYGAKDSKSEAQEAVLKVIDLCDSVDKVYMVVQELKEEELLPYVAFVASKKILSVGHVAEKRNLDNNPVYERLMNCLIFKGQTSLIFNMLHKLQRYKEVVKPTEMLGNELIFRCSENKLSIEECCQAIECLAQCGRHDLAEKFWSGIADQEKQISKENIHTVFAILRYLKISRKAVLNVLERRVPSVWWQMSPDSTKTVLRSLEKCKTSPFRITHTLARWLSTNIHAVSEGDLKDIVESFTNLNYCDNQIERSIERYVKAKGIKITSKDVILAILRHCQVFRLRNSYILNGCSEYFIAHHHELDPKSIKPIVCAFAYLDYMPVNSNKFWETLDMYLDLNFSKIHPAEIIDIMFCYISLERYPLNFVNRIFNPYFLDVLHAKTKQEQLDRVRSMLKVFDTCLALECPGYDGPLLPRDHSAKALFHDGRIKRIVNYILPELEELAGGADCLTKFTVLHNLPVNELYLVDVMFHPSGMGHFFSLNPLKERNINVAVLIHLPEYYSNSGENLIGPQAMRIRHLRRFGLKVVTLRFDVLYKLKVHPKELRKYLVERMKHALEALPAPNDAPNGDSNE
ncbi:FAST kinase domain-containing protein 3, mitochondrial-like [Sabethes cyaneus]|uniref:FAST kinase domain-containing protein 3, mitochondrial-like n=1 Tax=Sabethes cyaneus TaxID=53552 RepID=UPI00237E73FF|nr:FAST kinase domain-containing protein 3, mitochondrial-like [Sabethes cyaneus]